MKFTDFDLREKLLQLLESQKFTVPTPIQEKAIPPLLDGHDLMGLAQTGTGKTLAFVLPVIQKLSIGPRNRVRCLVVAPTRELALQITEVFKTFAGPFGLRCCPVFGGVGAHPQIEALKAGAEIVIACPGRLLDHLKTFPDLLKELDFWILDEADQMFDMGFLPDIRKIRGYLPKVRQNMLFSATMPEAIRHLALEILHKPVCIEIEANHVVETVSHALYPVRQELKGKLLLQLLQELNSNSVIVFTRTKYRAKRLSEQIQKNGLKAAQLQGNMSQSKRQDSLNGFREGRYHILVATDIAARGIDVSGVTHVINLDIPDTVEAYTHRIGRTGRAAKTGKAFTFCTDEDRQQILAIEKKLGYRIERKFLPGFDYHEQPVAGAVTKAENQNAGGARNSSRGKQKPVKEAHNGQDRTQRKKSLAERTRTAPRMDGSPQERWSKPRRNGGPDRRQEKSRA